MALQQNQEAEEVNSNLDCNICLDPSVQSVVSYCGHVFCWPCIYRWMEVQSRELFATENICPVCKSIITRDKLIPIYGQNSDNLDPRNTLPPRPLAQYSEPHINGSLGFADINANTLMASASFNFGGFGFRASLGPAQTIVGSWNINNSDVEDARNSIGQIFLTELTKNLFFSVSLLSFLYMLIV